MRWYVTSAPVTFVYLLILAITTWVLLGMPHEIRRLYITAQSTNLQHLTSDPIRVLIRSAFFVSKSELLAWIALFALVLAPAERWLGSGRVIVAFAVGHVGATALTALDIWVRIKWLNAPVTLWTVQDTGVSYGFACLAGLMLFRLRGRSRLIWGAILAAVVIYGLWPGSTFTDLGHACAIIIGLCLMPVTLPASVKARMSPSGSLRSLWRRSGADGPHRLGAAR